METLEKVWELLSVFWFFWAAILCLLAVGLVGRIGQLIALAPGQSPIIILGWGLIIFYVCMLLIDPNQSLRVLTVAGVIWLILTIMLGDSGGEWVFYLIVGPFLFPIVAVGWLVVTVFRTGSIPFLWKMEEKILKK